jgi:uroporphyrinogen decarboxylase
MTPRERVAAALEHRQPDAVPYHITFTVPARNAMVAYYGDSEFEANLGNCLTILRTRVPTSEVAQRIHRDEFGVLWDRSVDPDIGTVCNTAVTQDTLESYAFPDPLDPRRFAGFDAALTARGEKLAVASIAFTLFERAWTLAGMETVLMAMAGDDGFANELFDRILAWDAEVTRAALRYPVDAMRFGDDWGQQQGLIMGPALWRKFIKPRVARLYGMVKAAGKKVFIHSCGKVQEILPDLIEIGVDAFNPFQPEVMDVEAMKRTYGDRLTFFGGISTQRTLPYGSPDQVRAEVRRLCAAIGRDGGYIAAPAHDVPADARPENVAAMIDELRTQRA